MEEKTDSLKIRIPVCSFRKIPNPYSPEEDKDIPETKPQMYEMLVDATLIPNNFPMMTNPRDQNLNTKVAKKIQMTLTNDRDHNFYLLNRGLLLSAANVTYDNVNAAVVITFLDLSVHGDVDGGHTYKVILENQKYLEKGQSFVKIEVLTGVEDFFQDLAAARNTSVQVKDKSIAELEKRFDLIKDTIAKEPYANAINYKENDTKRIDVSDLLTLLFMFNIDKFPVTGTSHPISAYSAKKVCIDDYLKASKDFEAHPEKNPYVKMKPIMADIFRLYDAIEENMPEYYKQANPGKGRYGMIKGVGMHRPNTPHFKSRFYQKNIDYSTPNGFMYPILGAFRALVVEKNGRYEWLKNPFDTLQKDGAQLVSLIIDMHRMLGNNPNATGKCTPLWNSLFTTVRFETMNA